MPIFTASPTFPLMTVEEFEALPEPKGRFTHELHFGRLVKVERPNKGHHLLQCRIRDLLSRTLGTRDWYVEIEVSYNLSQGYDARAADVAVVSRSTYDKVPFEGCLQVSPELVVFVKSRSNTDAEIERAAIDCLIHGAKAAWYVKYDPPVVRVYTAAGKQDYRPGQVISLPAPMSGSIQVSDIFEDLK